MLLDYKEIKKQYDQCEAQQQELDSATYGLKSVNIDGEQYNFCCYYDKQEKGMRAVVLDKQYSQVQLAGHLSLQLYVEFGAFCLALQDWQEGKGDYPNIVPTEHQLDGLRDSMMNSIAEQNEEPAVYGETPEFDLTDEIEQAKELITTLRGQDDET